MPLGLIQTKKKRISFEGIVEGLTGGDDDIYDWFDKQVAENQKEIKEKKRRKWKMT